MTAVATSRQQHTEARARQSLGISDIAIYRMIAAALAKRDVRGELLLDIGCGVGHLKHFVQDRFARYVGVDLVRYEGFPSELEWIGSDLNLREIPLPDECADAVVAVETIEHLENPRAFMREVVRLTKPGGFVVVTTPNQLSFLSLLTLVVKHRFSAFQDVHYPAHLTALLEIDLRRIAAECRLTDIEVSYSKQGRLVLTPWHYPLFLSRRFATALSDNLLLLGRKRLSDSAPGEL